MLIILLFAPAALALMPPHVTKITPGHGGTLTGNTIVIEGYSLKYAPPDKELKLTGATTGKAVAYTHKLETEWVGKCDKDSKPGSCQQRSKLTLTITQKRLPDVIKLSYLGDEAMITVKTTPPKKR